jgi:hypothetical protein
MDGYLHWPCHCARSLICSITFRRTEYPLPELSARAHFAPHRGPTWQSPVRNSRMSVIVLRAAFHLTCRHSVFWGHCIRLRSCWALGRLEAGMGAKRCVTNLLPTKLTNERRLSTWRIFELSPLLHTSTFYDLTIKPLSHYLII